MRESANAERLAKLVDGEWESNPPDAWRLNRLASARRLARKGHATPGTLAYIEKRGQNLRKLASLQDAAENIVVLGDRRTSRVYPLPFLIVDDVNEALNIINRDSLSCYEGAIVSVTGSVGKSTTCAMISGLLSRFGAVASGRGNYLADVRSRAFGLEDEAFAVFEVARASLPGAEEFLQSDVVLITSIAEAHLELTSVFHDAGSEGCLDARGCRSDKG